MTVDQRVVIGNEVKKFTVKSIEEAPPIPLWKVCVVLLAIIGGTGAYYTLKGGE